MIDAPFRLTMHAGDVSASSAYWFERATFEREYGVSSAAHDAEFADYQKRSILVCVTDRQDAVVGMMRLVLPGADATAEPVKTFVEAAVEPWRLDVPRALRACGIDAARTWDVASLSVLRSLGRHRITVLGALYHALVNLVDQRGVRFLVMTVDERVRSTLRMVGLPTAALPGAQPMPFCGSRASTPAWGDCADMLAHQRRHNPDAYRLIRLGEGLSEVDLPTPEDYLRLASAIGPAPATEDAAIRALART